MIVFFSVSVFASEKECFGEKITSKKIIKVANLKPSKDKIVVAEGVIEAVCQSAGCWVVLRDGNKIVFVKAKDEGFAMPKNAAGATARAMGTVKEEEFSEAVLKHFEEDGLKLTDEVKKTKKMLYMDALGVEILPAKGMKLESTKGYSCPHQSEKSEAEKKHEKKEH
ncbi:MAG: DUF4920 domain-containing protein [bacterium]|nr:DUF4920 domain-containing protein [bacterium]